MKCFISYSRIILSILLFLSTQKIPGSMSVCLSDMENVAAEDTGYRHSQKQKDLFSFLGGELNWHWSWD
jgi:hypothetical protein